MRTCLYRDWRILGGRTFQRAGVMNNLLHRYEVTVRDYEQNWVALNKVLYDLCRRYPDHQRRDGVNAKLWVIGRTYATGIERQIRTQGTQGSSMTQLADHIWNHRRQVDTSLQPLGAVKEPLDVEKIKLILMAHGQLLSVIQPLLRTKLSPRTFVSKYLHFHCPAVPIYDNVAVSALRGLCPLRKNFQVIVLPKQADGQYGRYVLRFWQLYQDMRHRGEPVSVKLLDEFLLATVMAKI